jgi:NitT/TauT family transport system substrate-binding protein
MSQFIRRACRASRFTLLFVPALLLGGGGGARAQQKLLPVKIGTLRQSAQVPGWMAKKLGLYEKHGLDAELIEFRNGNEAISAQRGGHVDIIVTIPGTAMQANERGFDLVLIAQNEVTRKQPPDTGSIQVLKDSGIANVAGLAGKKMAISGLRGQMHVDIQTVLRKAGVDPAQVQFIEMRYPSMIDALKSHQVDAVALLDPWTTQLRLSGAGRVVAWQFVDSLPEQPTGAFYARKTFVDKNPEVVKRFAEALREAIDYLNADQARARAQVVAYTGLDAALIKQMPLNEWDYTINPDKWQALADMMLKGGGLDKPHKAEEFFSDYVKSYIAK